MDDRTLSGQQFWQWWQQAQQQAIAADIPLADLNWLMREYCGIDQLSLRLESFKHQPSLALPMSLADLDHLWQRRIRDRLPVQYLMGQVPWRDFLLRVSPAVLIPRPETELIIDHVAQAAQSPSLTQGAWVDLGTGSGAIALGLAQTLPSATIYAVDISAAALAIAQENAQRNGLGDRIQFYQGSWLEALPSAVYPLSGMVSNPPYIPTDLIPTLQPEVRLHEPTGALDGGADGLDCLRHLIQTAPHWLISGGFWMVELMDGQGDAVRSLLQQNGQYHSIEIARDLAGHERFAIAYRQ